MIAHLLESTLLLALAILIAHLPRLAARSRYAIVFAALMKFAIPSAIVPRFLTAFGIDLSGMKGTIVIRAIGPLSMVNLPQKTAVIWPIAAIAIWAAIAVALLTRSFLRGRSSVRRALANAIAAADGDLAALAHARERAGVKNAIRLIRSSSVATPATVGLLRPIIVLPSATELAGAELETILTHECAHIARRDNLLSIVEVIAGSALWFHPLVWMARRVLDAAREEACDAAVISSGDANTYVAALGKICGAAIAPRAAGMSCIVSNTIEERMNNIMRFGTRRLLPHRAVTTAVVALIAAVTIGSGVARALPSKSDDTATSPYKVEVSATRTEPYFSFHIILRSRKDGHQIQDARVKARDEEWATARTRQTDSAGEHETIVRAKGHADGTAIIEISVDGAAPSVAQIVAIPNGGETGNDKISVDLKDADIRDVLQTFGKLTNTTIIIDDDVTGRISVVFRDTPWTEAFESILDANNLRQERVGNTIHVYRK
jgi:beta-lactamase regulating signal transducer with metallopeptidase domain